MTDSLWRAPTLDLPPGGAGLGGAGNADRFSALLEIAAPFSVLHPDDLQVLAARVHRLRYRRGEVIFRDGEPARELYVIEQGSVKLYTVSRPGKELLVAILGPGQIFGELEVLDSGRREVCARAMDDVSLVVVDRHLFRAVLRSRPAFLRRLLELMARRLRRADQAAQDLVFFDATTRLARRLLQLAEEHGLAAEDGAEDIRLAVRVTQEEIAQMIGVNRTSANRLIRSFVTRGLIDWNDGWPVILKPSELALVSRS